jgi:hypothetical protein
MVTFCISTLECLPRLSFKYFRNYRNKVLVVQIIIGIAFAFTLNNNNNLINTKFMTKNHIYIMGRTELK